jgi:hypothetical protein
MPAARILALALAFLLAAPVSAQQLPLVRYEVPLPGVNSYSEQIPGPQDVIGHRIGERHTLPHQVVDYFRAIAPMSNRVTLHEYGRTYEGRPLIYAIVTSPANHARIEQIRQLNLRLSDTPSAVGEAEIATMPAVVYMGYSVHGNEASGTEAGVLLLYHLAAGEGPAVQEVLDNTVIILDPLFNPDGRARFAEWVNRSRGRFHTTDPNDLEHNEPWPGGRTNHYWFDLNRDWLPLQHPESIGRVSVLNDWRPQVLTDYHEMGGNATYFFQPGVPSRNNPNTPERTFELTARLAEFHARHLDRIGSLYYTRESFDDFYVGKGSTYPDLMGVVGILFEQASSRGLESETVDGNLHYAFTVRKQFVASLSTLEGVVAIRQDLLRHQRDFYAGATRFAGQAPVRAYVIDMSRDRTRAQALGQMLLQHRVRLYDLGQSLTHDGHTFRPGQAFVVPVDQPQARFVKAVMERQTSFTDSLFYDISTWTLPLAFNLPYAEISRMPGGLLGSEIRAMDFDGGELTGGRASYAYLMTWDRYFAPRALYRLQSAGIRARLMTRPFEIEIGGAPRSFERGTILIPVVQNDADAETIHRLIAEIVAEDHVRVFAAGGGLAITGIDFGSPNATVLEMPRVALVVGPGTSANNAGEVWHLLDQRIHMPVSMVEASRLRDADLSRYNTIVLAGVVAGGSYGALPAERIKEWVRGGGRLITLTNGTDWAVSQGFADLSRQSREVDDIFDGVPFDQVSNTRGAQGLGGSIFEARLDTTHPIAFGYGPTVPVFRSSSTFWAPSDQPGTNVAILTERPLLSGYISPQRLEQIGGSAALVARRYGSGRVTLFADNPNFRAFWFGTNGLFLNSLFFGNAF